jgi:hypothetical protein
VRERPNHRLERLLPSVAREGPSVDATSPLPEMSSERPVFGDRLPEARPTRRDKPAAPPDEDRVDDYRHETAHWLNLR